MYIEEKKEIKMNRKNPEKIKIYICIFKKYKKKYIPNHNYIQYWIC